MVNVQILTIMLICLELYAQKIKYIRADSIMFAPLELYSA